MRFYTEEATQKFDAVHLNYIQTELKNHVFTLTLNRPEKRNAFTPTMAAEIAFSLAFAHYKDDVRCVVLKANGPVFCAGADLNAFHDPNTDLRNVQLPIRKKTLSWEMFSGNCINPASHRLKVRFLQADFY